MTTRELDHCAGCGVTLQTNESKQLGYIPQQALDRSPIICQRCFRIKHYNESSSITHHSDDYLTMLGHVGETDSLIINIVDIFDFEGSMISSLQRFVGGNPVILVVNKIDLLPEITNWNKIVNWVRKQAKEHGLKIEEIVLCSATKDTGFDRVIETMDRYRKGRDIYVVGATNVGKSTLINRLIRDYSQIDAELTTSRYPGTTLDLVKIPLDDGKFIVDTPGIVYSSRLTEMVSKADLQILMPGTPLKPKVYQLNEQQTLFFGALARFDFVQGERQSFTCFIANSLAVHRTKLERADHLYETHKGEMLSPPATADLDELPPFSKHQIRIPKGSEKDIVICGLGWIKVNSTAGAVVDVHAPKGIKVVLRDSII